MSGEVQSVPTSPTSANNLNVPVGPCVSGKPGIVRRLSQMASNFSLSAVESQLTDDAIRELGEKLLRDYIRDRLYRSGILPDDHGFIEENNNLVNGVAVGATAENECSNVSSSSNSDFPPTRGSHTSSNDVGSQFHLGVSSSSLSSSRRPASRSNSFVAGSQQRQGSPSSGPRSPVSTSGRRSPASSSGLRSPSSPLPSDGGTHPLGDFVPATRRRTSVSSSIAPTAQPVDAIAVALRRYCLYLEKAHAVTYREVSRPLCITMTSLNIIQAAINHIVDSVLTEVKENDASSSLSSPNTLWARIASLYVLTSTFCLDCTVQGHAEHIRDVVTMSMDRIFCREVCSKIRSVGGWSNLVDISKESKKEKEYLPVVLVVVMGAVLGLIPAWLFHLVTPQIL